MAYAEWTLTGALHDARAPGLDGYIVLDARCALAGMVSGQVYTPGGLSALVRIAASDGPASSDFLLPVGAIRYIDDRRRCLGLRQPREALPESSLPLTADLLPPPEQLKRLIRYCPNPTLPVLARLAEPTRLPDAYHQMPRWRKLSRHDLPPWRSLREYG